MDQSLPRKDAEWLRSISCHWCGHKHKCLKMSFSPKGIHRRHESHSQHPFLNARVGSTLFWAPWILIQGNPPRKAWISWRPDWSHRWQICAEQLHSDRSTRLTALDHAALPASPRTGPVGLLILLWGQWPLGPHCQEVGAVVTVVALCTHTLHAVFQCTCKTTSAQSVPFQNNQLSLALSSPRWACGFRSEPVGNNGALLIVMSISGPRWHGRVFVLYRNEISEGLQINKEADCHFW